MVYSQHINYMEYKHHSLVRFFITLAASILISFPLLTNAAPTLPDAKVWVTPADAVPAESIALHAFVYNTEKQDITFTISFKAQEKEVATATLLVPAESAKVATATWVMPEESVVVNASVTKAETKLKKDIASLHGPLGTVTVGSIAALPKLSIPGGSTVKAWIGTFLEKVEVFRARKAGYYIRLREETKEKLGINTFQGAIKVLVPNTPEPTAVPGDKATEKPAEVKNDPMDYATLVYSAALASLFAQKAIFYIVFILFVLFIIRFFVSRFF
jgi:hypothetical protein